MKNNQVGMIITVVAAVAGIAHAFLPSVKIDWITVALIIIAAVPWLGPILKSLEITGIGKVELRDRQGTTSNPPPPQGAEPTNKFSPQARKILATLWHYQKKHFGDTDSDRRWTFNVTPGTTFFLDYMTGLLELVKSGLVSVIPDKWQCVLTNEGFSYCKNEKSLESETNIYKFS